jgi:6-phosphogluconolactonase
MVDMKIARRLPWLFLVLGVLSSAVALPAQAATKSGKYLLYVGTYTARGSKGIYDYHYDAATGEIGSQELAAETSNPSFVAVSPNHHFLYAVNEDHDYQGTSSGVVSAFSLDQKTGKLTLLNQLASRGADPCHISLDHTGKFVLVANYTGGNLTVFPILADGRLGEASDFIQHKGTGPNHERQEAAHAHWIDLSPDNRFALNADLGLDEVFVYHFDSAKGKLSPDDPPFAKLAAGAGPRHVAFHPDGKFVYVISELNSTVTTFSYDAQAGALHELQAVSTLPKDFTGENSTAEIVVHPNGKFLYASNRGHDSLAVFAIDPEKGTLTFVEHVPVKGKTPRNFEIDPTGTRLFVANQETDNIVVFDLDPKTGKLKATGQELKVAAPVCIRFVPVD